MKIFFAGASLLLSLAATTYSGPAQTFDKGLTTSDETPGWYAAREFNVQLWATYAFTAKDREDRYLQSDHAWGGGLDAKYFFNRYVGVGVEGYLVSRTASVTSISATPLGITTNTVSDTRAIGAGLATVTLRCPIGASHLAPYIFAGGGFIAGGGQEIRHEFVAPAVPFGAPALRTTFVGDATEAIGQFGGGLEVRLSRHIGFINDFSWNVVDGRDNNFGMARSGINLVF